ncbi:hypothetical protein AgCh_033985 [Apium graveolens]
MAGATSVQFIMDIKGLCFVAITEVMFLCFSRSASSQSFSAQRIPHKVGQPHVINHAYRARVYVREEKTREETELSLALEGGARTSGGVVLFPVTLYSFKNQENPLPKDARDEIKRAALRDRIRKEEEAKANIEKRIQEEEMKQKKKTRRVHVSSDSEQEK